MKTQVRALLFFAFLGLPFAAFSQVVVEGININEIKYVKMIQVVASQRFLSTKFNILIDYGQPTELWQTSNVRDEETGKQRKFNSIMDAVNYMENNGWQYVDALVVSDSSSVIYRYNFRRKEETASK